MLFLKRPFYTRGYLMYNIMFFSCIAACQYREYGVKVDLGRSILWYMSVFGIKLGVRVLPELFTRNPQVGSFARTEHFI